MARPKSNHVQINISIPKEWKTEKEAYQKIRKQYHKCSDRHILVIETEMSDCGIKLGI